MLGIIVSAIIASAPMSAAKPPAKVYQCGTPVALTQGSGTVRYCEWR